MISMLGREMIDTRVRLSEYERERERERDIVIAVIKLVNQLVSNQSASN
jgi:hypothetical protein